MHSADFVQHRTIYANLIVRVKLKSLLVLLGDDVTCLFGVS